MSESKYRSRRKSRGDELRKKKSKSRAAAVKDDEIELQTRSTDSASSPEIAPADASKRVGDRRAKDRKKSVKAGASRKSIKGVIKMRNSSKMKKKKKVEIVEEVSSSESSEDDKLNETLNETTEELKHGPEEPESPKKFELMRSETQAQRKSMYSHLTVDVRYFVASMLVRDAHMRRPHANYNLDPTRMRWRIIYDKWYFVAIRNLALLVLVALLVIEDAYDCEIREDGIPMSCSAITNREVDISSSSFFMEVTALAVIAISIAFLMFEKGAAVVNDKMVMTVSFFLMLYVIVFTMGYQAPSFAKTSWHVRGLLRVTFFLQKGSVIDVLQDMGRTVRMLIPTLLLYLTCVFLFGFYANILYGHLPGMEVFADQWSAFRTAFVFATTANFPNVFLPSYGAAWTNCLFFIFGEVLFVYLFFNVILVNVYDAFKQSMARKRADGIVNRKIALDRAFEILDEDNSGSIHRNEFLQGMKFVFPDLDNEELQVIFEDMDRDGDDSISQIEFSNICYYLGVSVDLRKTDEYMRTHQRSCDLCHTIAYEIFTGVLCAGTAVVYFVVFGQGETDADGDGFADDPLQESGGPTEVLWLLELVYCAFLAIELIIRFFSRPAARLKDAFKNMPFKDKLDVFIFIVCFMILMVSYVDGAHLTGVKRCVCYRLLRIPRLGLRLSKKSEEIVSFTAQVIPTLGAPLLTLCMWLYLGVVVTMFVFGGEMTIENLCKLKAEEFDGADDFNFVWDEGGAQWTDIDACIAAQPVAEGEALYQLLHFNDAKFAATTLFVLMVNNNWNDLMSNTTQLTGEAFSVLFMVFFLVTSVIILNIIIALFIDSYFMISAKQKLNKIEEERTSRRNLITTGLHSKYMLTRNLALSYDELVHGVAETNVEKKKEENADGITTEDVEQGDTMQRAASRANAIKIREANEALQRELEEGKAALELKEADMVEKEREMRGQKREFERKFKNLLLTKRAQDLQAKEIKAQLVNLKAKKDEQDAFMNANEEEKKNLENAAASKFMQLQRKIALIEDRERLAEARIAELDQEDENRKEQYLDKVRDLEVKMEDDLSIAKQKMHVEMTEEFKKKEQTLVDARKVLAEAQDDLEKRELELDEKYTLTQKALKMLDAERKDPSGHTFDEMLPPLPPRTPSYQLRSNSPSSVVRVHQDSVFSPFSEANDHDRYDGDDEIKYEERMSAVDTEAHALVANEEMLQTELEQRREQLKRAQDDFDNMPGSVPGSLHGSRRGSTHAHTSVHASTRSSLSRRSMDGGMMLLDEPTGQADIKEAQIDAMMGMVDHNDEAEDVMNFADTMDDGQMSPALRAEHKMEIVIDQPDDHDEMAFDEPSPKQSSSRASPVSRVSPSNRKLSTKPNVRMSMADKRKSKAERKTKLKVVNMIPQQEEMKEAHAADEQLLADVVAPSSGRESPAMDVDAAMAMLDEHHADGDGEAIPLVEEQLRTSSQSGKRHSAMDVDAVMDAALAHDDPSADEMDMV